MGALRTAAAALAAARRLLRVGVAHLGERGVTSTLLVEWLKFGRSKDVLIERLDLLSSFGMACAPYLASVICCALLSMRQCTDYAVVPDAADLDDTVDSSWE
jgi:hypothetical protein